MFCLAVIVSVVYFLCMPIVEGSPFHSSFHYICHFSIMVLGAIVYDSRNQIRRRHIWVDIILLMISFVGYFLILAIGKGKTDVRYYLQILALLPLHSFVYYAYKVASYGWVNKCFGMKYIGKGMSVIASLTLEIYVVQFMIITNQFNRLFPLNTIIVFMLICVAAYFLKVVTSIFLSIMSTEPFRIKEIVKI